MTPKDILNDIIEHWLRPFDEEQERRLAQVWNLILDLPGSPEKS